MTINRERAFCAIMLLLILGFCTYLFIELRTLNTKVTNLRAVAPGLPANHLAEVFGPPLRSRRIDCFGEEGCKLESYSILRLPLSEDISVLSSNNRIIAVFYTDTPSGASALTEVLEGGTFR